MAADFESQSWYFLNKADETFRTEMQGQVQSPQIVQNQCNLFLENQKCLEVIWFEFGLNFLDVLRSFK